MSHCWKSHVTAYICYLYFQARCHRLHKALDDFVKFESFTLQHLHVDDDHNTTVGTSVLEWQEQYNGNNTTAKNQSNECGQTKSQSGMITFEPWRLISNNVAC